jgi:hypothetical protein
MKPGDVYALNAPYDGGTHLPDVTVIMPVFAADDDAAPAWFVAARGHHADIGGISPGSMPPDSVSVEQEGVIIDNLLLVDAAISARPRCACCSARGAGRRAIPTRTSPTLPRRSPPARAAGPSCGGSPAITGRDVVDAYMGHVQANAEAAVRGLIGTLRGGSFAYAMDDGATIRVAVSVDRPGAYRQDRFHRYQRAASRQFQRASVGGARGRAVRAARLIDERCRSTTVACARSRSSSPRDRCCIRASPRRWSRAMSRPAR